jgi:butyryl-CoA dehydrogenase
VDLFLLNDHQKMILETARDFATKQIAPVAHELDQTGRFPKELVQQLGEMGFMGMMVPEEHGGAGLDSLSYAIAMEVISSACASTGVIMSVNNSLVCAPIEKYGSAEQKKKFLEPLASGKKLGCFALSEPGNGSDAVALRTVAKRDGDHYIINGTKNWITNGKEADVCVFFATIDKEKGAKGVCAFIVEKGTPGFSVGKVEEKLGIHASSTTQLMFDNVRLPVSQLLGEEGQGFKIAMWTLDGGRIGIAAQAVGIASAALEAAKKFAREREAFGAPIGKLQGIQWHIADMATKVDAARLLTWRAAMKKDQGDKYTREAAMAKLFASEAATWVANKGLQVHGGYGYVIEYPAERHYRDAKITEIYEGTSEIQRIVIGRTELGL